MNESFVDDEFIRNVIEKYSDMIYRVSFQFVRNRQDAEDVLQDVFLGLLEQLSRAEFQSEEHLKAWLIRVSINKCKNFSKSNTRRKKREASEFTLPQERTELQYEELESVLNKLSAIDREIIYMHYYEGYSAREIAEILEKTEKSIFKRLSRSRNKIKDYLEGDEQL